MASTLTVTVLILEFVSSRFMTFNSGFGVGKAHMIIAVVIVFTVSTSYKTIVGLMYCVRNALALYRYAERARMTASVTQASLRLAMAANKSNFAGKCMFETKV